MEWAQPPLPLREGLPHGQTDPDQEAALQIWAGKTS
jgi:hypothetical protein